MNTTSVAIPVKKTGGKRLFTEAVEEEIARLYYDDDISSTDLADRFRPLSKTGKCSPTTIRNVARDGQVRRVLRTAEAAS